MGKNVNLVNMLGLPEIIECPNCGVKIKSYFQDHDIQCCTIYDKGHWQFNGLYCDECHKDFKYEFQIKIEVISNIT